MIRHHHVTDRVYIRDEKYAWLPGTIVARDNENDRVRVRIDLPPDWKATTLTSTKDTYALNKMERWVNLNDYRNKCLPIQNTKVVKDIAELPHLHEAAILHQIKNRHIHHQPYTRVGDIVVAVNPYQWLDELYTIEQQRHYAKCFVWQVPLPEPLAPSPNNNDRDEKKEDSCISQSQIIASSTPFSSWYEQLGHEPHVYEVSSLAYRGLVLEGKDQTILVSGESGSGKTETVKVVLRHLATIDVIALSTGDDNSDGCLLKERSSEKLIQKIVESSPVLEAFGNARTVTNHNSSRFGKVTRLHFRSNETTGILGLEGSTCDTYLLETSRVVSHAPGERNFHIFYQLLSMPNEKKIGLLGPDWKGATVGDFRYLSSSGRRGTAEDADMAAATFETLEFFQWSSLYLQMLMRALGTVLRIGNISFVSSIDGEASISSEEDLAKLAASIGIQRDIIEKAMTRRSLKNSKEELTVPVTAEYAKDACDALAKTMYARVFESVVRAVNGETGSPKDDEEYAIISLVDIFGFERFDTNRFEQLCINYASEKLQQKYIQDNLKRYKEEYVREGIELADLEEFDNSGTIELLEGPRGVINLLNEECVRLDGSSEAFVSRMKHACSANKSLIKDKVLKEAEFGIHHFAGPVVYQASSFVERNSDKLPESLLRLAMQSSNPLIAAEFGELLKSYEQGISSDVKKKHVMHMTVIDKFRCQLKELMSAMQGSQMRYIRCIKPNESMKQDCVDHQTTMRQLKCAGLVTAVELSREIFPNKLTFKVVEERFRCILNPEMVPILQDLDPDEIAQFMMTTLFSSYIKEYSASGNFTMPFACGKTRIYYRAGALEILEARRNEYFSGYATTIQRLAKRFCNSLREERASKYIVQFQSLARGFIVRSAYTQKRLAAIKIQAAFRMHTDRLDYKKKIKAIGIISGVCNAFVETYREHKRNDAAIVISSWYRSRVASIRFHRVIRAIISMQAATRMVFQRIVYTNKLKAATIVVQTCSAFIEGQRQLNQEKAAADRGRKYDEAATTISAWYRAGRDQRRFHEVRTSLLSLQATGRMYIERAAYKRKYGAAKVVVRACYRFVEIQQQQAEEAAALRICTWYRSQRDAIMFRQVIRSIIVLQAFVRRNLEEAAYEKKMSATRLIINTFLEYRQRQKYNEAAVKIATWYRGGRDWNHYQRNRRQIVLLQAIVRMGIQRSVYTRKLNSIRTQKELQQGEAATVISSWYRSQSKCLQFQKHKLSIVSLQAVVRGNTERTNYRKRLSAAILIAEAIGRMLHRSKCERAVTTVSAWYRSRREFRQYQRVRRSVIALQASVRRYIQRLEYVKMVKARLAAHKKKKAEKKAAKRLRRKKERAATTISSRYRSQSAYLKYQQSRNAIIALQAAVRARSLRDNFLIKKGATLYIEYWISNIRLHQAAQKQFCDYKSAAIAIQTWARAQVLGISQWQSQCPTKQVVVTQEYNNKDDESLHLSTVPKGQAIEIDRLKWEVEHHKNEISDLNDEIRQISTEAELHSQEIQAECEEKVTLYEDEVLELKTEIAKQEQEKDELKKQVEKYKKRLQYMQKGIQKTQISHRDYLDKIMSVLDETEAARQHETQHIREELEEVKRDRGIKINALKEEVAYLRSLEAVSGKASNSRTNSKNSRKLCLKLHATISPENLLTAAKEAEEQPGNPQRHIEEKICGKARSMLAQLEQIISVADEADLEKSEALQTAQEESMDLREQLNRAYEEIRLLNDSIVWESDEVEVWEGDGSPNYLCA